MDWAAFGLPVEGDAAAEPTIGDLARRDTCTCRLDERLADLVRRVTGGWTWCAVVDDADVLLGRVRRSRLQEVLQERTDATVEEAMESGPSTYRPSMPAAEMAESMRSGGFERTYVTDSDGRLLGLVSRADLERALYERAS